MRSGTSFPRSQRNKGIGTAVKANLVSASIKKCHPPASAHTGPMHRHLSGVVSTSYAPLHAYRGACTTTRGINSSRWKILLSLQTQKEKKGNLHAKCMHSAPVMYPPRLFQGVIRLYSHRTMIPLNCISGSEISEV